MTNMNLVKELRSRTQAKLNDCKLALENSGDDLELAIEYLQKKGQADSIKRAGNICTEGIVSAITCSTGKVGAMVEINCQTDFAAKSQEFIDFVQKVVMEISSSNNAHISFETIEEDRIKLVQKLGENINIRRFERLLGPIVVDYVHNNKIAVLVAGHCDKHSVLNDIALQIAAMNPKYVSVQNIPVIDLKKQSDIFESQLKDEGKVPETRYPQIIKGKIDKWAKEVCLLQQTSILDQKKTVEQCLKDNNINIEELELSFIRYEVGEGLEQKQTDFASEVQALV